MACGPPVRRRTDNRTAAAIERPYIIVIILSRDDDGARIALMSVCACCFTLLGPLGPGP